MGKGRPGFQRIACCSRPWTDSLDTNILYIYYLYDFIQHETLSQLYSFHSSRPSLTMSACSNTQNLSGALPSSAMLAAATAALPMTV